MLLLNALLAMMASWSLLTIARFAAPKIGLVDLPDNRKVHDQPTPLVGGLAVVPVLGIVALLYFPDLETALALVTAMTLIFVMGLADDIADIPASVRLLIQILAAGILIWFGDTRIIHLGDLFGAGDVVGLGPLSELFTIICIVTAINAFNMIDGADGLLSSLTIIALLCLAALFVGGAAPAHAVFCLVSILVLMPYLAANLMPHDSGKKVFMGDAGSMVIGLFIAFICINGASTIKAFDPIYALFAIALPIFDLIRVFVARIMRGVSPFTAERNHIHHVLSHTGKSASLAIIVATAGAIAGIGIFMQSRGFAPHYTFAMFIGVIVFLACQVKVIRLHASKSDFEEI